MLLEHKKAVIYGAGGAIGCAVARAFAHEGADLFLAGRTRARVESVAEEISAAGGAAEAAEVDALDEDAIEKHMDDEECPIGAISSRVLAPAVIAKVAAVWRRS